MYCSKCGNMVEDKQYCDKCGNKVGEAPEPAAQQTQQHMVYRREKSEGIAAVLSVIWPGLGQIYTGRIGRGLGIMVLGIFVVFLGFLFFPLLLLIPIYWIWNIYDAYKLAQWYNNVLRSTGNNPW